MAAPHYWFPAKRYGWGWGPPRAWQGWLVLAAFVALLALGAIVILPTRQPVCFGVYDEADGLPRGQDDDGAQGQQCHEGRQHEPALPGAGRPPAPAVALCREPVVRRGHCSLHRDRERGNLGRRDILLPRASIFEAQLLLSGLERREL